MCPHTHMHPPTRRECHVTVKRDWGDMTVPHGTHHITANHQKPGEKHGMDSSSWSLEGTNLLTPWSWMSRLEDRGSSISVTHPVSGILLWQSLDTNADRLEKMNWPWSSWKEVLDRGPFECRGDWARTGGGPILAVSQAIVEAVGQGWFGPSLQPFMVCVCVCVCVCE
jgi:hypothetical protein